MTVLFHPTGAEAGPLNADRPLRVLVVDDNPMVRESLRMVLDAAFPRIGQGSLVWAGSLGSATDLLEECKRNCPDIVLLDLTMPGLDPFTAIAQLQAHCPAARVIVYSGSLPRSAIDRALQAGAWGVVSKLQPMSALLQGIREVASGRLYVNAELSDERWKPKG